MAVHGGLPSWRKPTTVLGHEAQAAAHALYTKWVREAWGTAAAQAANERIKHADEEHREHAARLTEALQAAEQERDALRAELADVGRKIEEAEVRGCEWGLDRARQRCSMHGIDARAVCDERRLTGVTEPDDETSPPRRPA